jgi:hypothetical protein
VTKREFASEFGGIINLLKDHSFLQYSPAGQPEYDQKVATAAAAFVDLMRAYSGRELPHFSAALVPISPSLSPSLEGARRLAKRVADAYKAQARAARGVDAPAWAAAANAWEGAYQALGK